MCFPYMYSFHTFQKYLAEIFTKTCFMAAILNKMQDGGHIGVRANVNIVFLIAYVISLPKMYSFHTLQKIPTKLHSELDYSESSVRLSLGSFKESPTSYLQVSY